jgi:hypothetical protein
MTSRSSAWTAERRALQAMRIRLWRPWEHSTGPRSAAGKANSSRNADRPDSLRRQLKALAADMKMTLRGVKNRKKS